jgi:hypothetical protein
MGRPASRSNGGSVPRELATRLLRSHFPYTVTERTPSSSRNASLTALSLLVSPRRYLLNLRSDRSP